jgi:hypothetical protein
MRRLAAACRTVWVAAALTLGGCADRGGAGAAPGKTGTLRDADARAGNRAAESSRARAVVDEAPRAGQRAKRPAARDPAWRVVRQLTAHHILVAEVETEAVDQAVQIAQTLTEPIKDRYAEALVYIRRPGPRGPLPARRVQWTAASGYVEIDYER